MTEYRFPLVGYHAPCGCRWDRDRVHCGFFENDSRYTETVPAGWKHCKQHNEDDHPQHPEIPR